MQNIISLLLVEVFTDITISFRAVHKEAESSLPLRN